jgi:hypothetical protein
LRKVPRLHEGLADDQGTFHRSVLEPLIFGLLHERTQSAQNILATAFPDRRLGKIDLREQYLFAVLRFFRGTECLFVQSSSRWNIAGVEKLVALEIQGLGSHGITLEIVRNAEGFFQGTLCVFSTACQDQSFAITAEDFRRPKRSILDFAEGL